MKQLTRYIILIFVVALSSCSSEKTDEHANHQAKPDTTETTSSVNNDLMLTDSQIKLANVTTQKATVKEIGERVLVNARLVENQDQSASVNSRVAGRIEKLYVKETGRTIRKGEPLYDIYSETLLTLQKEFLLAKEQFETLGSTEKRYKSFYEAARKKLLLYGLSESQVRQIEKSQKTESLITFLSPISGIISELSVSEGQYVAEGTSIVKIEDVSTLWVEAELYANESVLAKIGDKIKVQIAGFESSPTEAVITFLSPEYRANSQITTMRATIQNQELKYQPGMQAQVFFTHSTKKAIAVPSDAIIRDGNGSHVYVQRGQNNFRPQMVETGAEDFENVEITKGIVPGDTVVITGAYLLYSEIILKKGTDPMAAHNH